MGGKGAMGGKGGAHKTPWATGVMGHTGAITGGEGGEPEAERRRPRASAPTNEFQNLGSHPTLWIRLSEGLEALRQATGRHGADGEGCENCEDCESKEDCEVRSEDPGADTLAPPPLVFRAECAETSLVGAKVGMVPLAVGGNGGWLAMGGKGRHDSAGAPETMLAPAPP